MSRMSRGKLVVSAPACNCNDVNLCCVALTDSFPGYFPFPQPGDGGGRECSFYLF